MQLINVSEMADFDLDTAVRIYALTQQAMYGDVQGDRPGLL